jgi:RNA 3'-terminal phosphate cyclase (ATP)
MSISIEIDGSFGEGGGQILRSALAMSLVTRRPFRITKIRAGRKKPGLLHQHLTSVKAATAISQAEVKGDSLGSQELYFAPKTVNPGQYHLAVGTAGSCTLVLQTVLPALLTAGGQSRLHLEGGTHNPFAPPFDFLAKAFLPIVNRMGPKVTADLRRPGFYPAGGGEIEVSIEPAATLSGIDLLERGQTKKQLARAMVAQLPRSIGERELKVVQDRLAWDRSRFQVEQVKDSRGPGNALIIEIESENITEVYTGFGQRGVPAEEVADKTVREVQEYLAAGVPVGKHLADQLLIPMALANGSKFRTLPLTDHTTTNIQVLKQFLNVEIQVLELADNIREIHVTRE